MKNIFKTAGLLLLCAGTILPTMISCQKDDFDTNQYIGGVNLNVWGPRPVARGGELRFLGSGLDHITSVSIPGSADVSDIRVVSPEEIRITVPQDAEPGKVTLHHAGGDIESLTAISFTEPISISEIAPSPVKPGSTLTITGDYLNLIKEVIFTEDVAVDEDAFLAHSRGEIKLTVPEEARTGEIIVSDGAKPIPNWIYSDEEVKIVLPSVEKVADLTKVKPGETVTFTVRDIDLVRKVVLPSDKSVDFNVSGSELSFKFPSDVTDGTICMVPASGVKVALATIGVALPEQVAAVPAENIWGGDIIRFRGVNMELVTSVSFPNVENAVEPETKSATEITVKVPKDTRSGNAVLHTASGGSVETPVSTLKPESVSFSPVPAALASTLTVSGRNLQHVVSVTFATAETVEVPAASATGFSLTVPATIEAGSCSVTLNLSNGETVDAGTIELTAPVCAYATELPSAEEKILAGSTFTVTIANEGRLTGVKMNGIPVQYILNGKMLIVQVPANAGADSTLTLVSDNGEVSYSIQVIPSSHMERVVLSEARDLGSWKGEADGGAFRLYKEQFEGAPAGAKLVFYISPYAYTQLQMNDANWGQMDMLQPDQSADRAEFVLTADILNRILTTDDGWSTTAMVVQGEGCVVNKVTLEWEIE